jgi:uracil-DNA glycosylase
MSGGKQRTLSALGFTGGPPAKRAKPTDPSPSAPSSSSPSAPSAPSSSSPSAPSSSSASDSEVVWPLTLLDTASDWIPVLAKEAKKEYLSQLRGFVARERAGATAVFPAEANTLQALACCPLSRVTVVLLGQDPYHGAGQAHGLSFSVERTAAIPPSLRNMYKEIEAERKADGLAPANFKTGLLTGWARQGVLLLNTVLTVRSGAANSHQNQGWEKFTRAIVEAVVARDTPAVFLLFGKPAQKLVQGIPGASRHHLILTAHPSPLSAHTGFFGQRPFARANEWLLSQSRQPIDWAKNEE